jgi:tight adherence protein B
MFVLVAFLLFSAALFGVAYYVWVIPQQEAARVLDARLRSVRSTAGRGRQRAASDLMRAEAKRGTFSFLGDFVAWLGIVRRLQIFITQANLTYRGADVAGISIAIVLIAYVVLDFFVPILMLRLFLALVVGAAPIAWIVKKRNARLAKFEEQLPDAIDLFTRTMRAGHNIHSGLETIAAETSNPVRKEFRKLMEELALGSQIEPALHNLGERIPLIDLKFFITGLILQRQTGANMVAVLENLSVLVRERLNMAAKLKAHTAQQRLSAGLLCALPFIVGVGFEILKPDYLRLLWTDPTGVKFLTYAIISECIGILVIRRMANIRF